MRRIAILFAAAALMCGLAAGTATAQAPPLKQCSTGSGMVDDGFVHYGLTCDDGRWEDLGEDHLGPGRRTLDPLRYDMIQDLMDNQLEIERKLEELQGYNPQDDLG